MGPKGYFIVTVVLFLFCSLTPEVVVSLPVQFPWKAPVMDWLVSPQNHMLKVSTKHLRMWPYLETESLQVQWRPLGWALSQDDCISIKRENWRQTQLIYQKTPCEDEDGNLQAMRKGWEQIPSSQPSEGADLPEPWFWTSSFRNCEIIHFCFLSIQICSPLLWQPETVSLKVSDLFSTNQIHV